MISHLHGHSLSHIDCSNHLSLEPPRYGPTFHYLKIYTYQTSALSFTAALTDSERESLLGINGQYYISLAIVAMLPTTLLLLILVFLFFNRFLRKQRPIDTEETNESTTQDSKSHDLPSPSRHDIYHVAFLLQQKLPPELVPEIIDYAKIWLRSHASNSEERKFSDQNSYHHLLGEASGSTYLSSLPIGEIHDESENGIGLVGLNPVRRIAFTVESRDQGWSSYSEDYGTERNSWTWFEALAREAEEPRYQEILEQEWDNIVGTAGPAIGVPEPRSGVKIMTNLHAGKDWRRKTISWDADSADEEIRTWILGLKRGQIVDLNACAKYSGWTNHVRAAEIKIYVAAVR